MENNINYDSTKFQNLELGFEKICKCIESSECDEHLKSCENMIENFHKIHNVEEITDNLKDILKNNKK